MGRLWRILTGWFLRLIGKAEAANPEAILEALTEESRVNMARFNEGLARQAGLGERLKMQIERQEKEVAALTQRASAAYAAKNMEKAGQFAMMLKEKKKDLADNCAQHAQVETMFQTLTRQRNVFAKQVEDRLTSIKSKISKAQMHEAQAKLAEMAQSVQFATLDTSGLSRLDEQLDERIANAQGKVRVAADAAASGMGAEWEMTEAEQRATEAAALAEFATEMGFEVPPQPKVVDLTTSHDLGPAEVDLAFPELDSKAGA